nr:reverse transcriptase domain-containing protein [Tanacetum cinerariifolium]
MLTWCHMFNSILTGNARVWFDDLPQESIDSYDDLKKAFLENYLQQKKCFKDPVEIHNIKQRDRESTEEFVRRYKLECRDEARQKQNFMKGGFRNQKRSEQKQDRFTLLTKTPKEILALDKGKFKPPPSRKAATFNKRTKAKQWERPGNEDETEGPMIIKAEMRGGGILFIACMWIGGPIQKSCMNTASIDFTQRKAKSKENLSSSVYSSWNAKILSDRRNGHITKQQDYSTRVHC